MDTFSVNKISSLRELSTFLSPLRELFEKELRKYWTPQDWDSFFETMMEEYANGSEFYGDLKDDKILYFMGVLPRENETAFFWILYANSSFRAHTNKAVKQVLKILKDRGVKNVSFTTRRLTSSYSRWVEKQFNAKPVSKTYEIHL